MSGERPLIQVAPMMHVTDKHFRNYVRLISKECQLWTDMKVDEAIIHRDKLECYLGHNSVEEPLVCQLGGSNLDSMSQAAEVVESWGYREINLNIGCPSDQVVTKGKFGAILMKECEVVRDIVNAIKRKTQLPVSIKTRTGVDSLDDDEFLKKFIQVTHSAGVDHFILHARKALLKSRISPKKNRSVPPLNYSRVFRLCESMPNIKFSLNGGIKSINDAVSYLGIHSGETHVDYRTHHSRDDENCEMPGTNKEMSTHLYGVMIGRAVMKNPLMLIDVDRDVYGCRNNKLEFISRRSIVQKYVAYLESLSQAEVDDWSPFTLVKPIATLFSNYEGNLFFRHHLDRGLSFYKYSPIEAINEAFALYEENFSNSALDSCLRGVSVENFTKLQSLSW